MKNDFTPITLKPALMSTDSELLDTEDIGLLEPETDDQDPQETDPHKVIFWKCKYDQETGAFKDVIINQLLLLKVYRLMGFLRLDIENSSIMVKVKNSRIISPTTNTIIVDEFFDFLNKKPFWLEPKKFNRNMLIEKFLKSMQTYFKEDKLHRVKPEQEVIFNRDTLTEKFFYFKNGFIKITAESIEFNDYSKLENYIWESEILDRKFELTSTKASNFEDFVRKISTSKVNPDPKRFDALRIIIGYLLHNFTDYKLMAILFTDSTISEGNEANGRTGKSLIAKGIGYMLSSNPSDGSISTFIDINGKNFDPKDKHKYQLVSYETKVICINDLKKYFDVDSIYNDVTEGILVEPKNLKPFKVPVKIILSSNKTVKIDGDSSKDRFLEFEVSDFFSRRLSPEMQYKQWFFRDWDAEEWNAFQLFMCNCVQFYFKNGCKLIEPAQINLNIRKLQENTSQEFMDYMQDKQFQFETWYNKKDLYNEFCARYEDYKNDPKFKQAKFSTWLTDYTKYHPALETYNKKTDEKRNDSVIEICFRPAKNPEA